MKGHEVVREKENLLRALSFVSLNSFFFPATVACLGVLGYLLRAMQMWLRTIWLGCWLALLAAQIGAEQLPLKLYTTADGLVHENVNEIVRDSHGYLWFCTLDGLSRFDGYRFVNYGVQDGLPHSSVNDLVESRTGAYWLATYSGAVRAAAVLFVSGSAGW